MSKVKSTLWETEAAEHRLTQRHFLALTGKVARNKKLRWVQEMTQALREEIAQWQYLPHLEAPDIEIAWIIHSHIVWRGTDADPEDLYPYLPETDPARIVEAEAEGPESHSPLPTETIRVLHNLLIRLEKFGCDIRAARFSTNWSCPSKGSTKGKNSMPKGNKPLERPAKKAVVKPTPPKKPKKDERKKNKLLADFFELKEN